MLEHQRPEILNPKLLPLTVSSCKFLCNILKQFALVFKLLLWFSMAKTQKKNDFNKRPCIIFKNKTKWWLFIQVGKWEMERETLYEGSW